LNRCKSNEYLTQGFCAIEDEKTTYELSGLAPNGSINHQSLATAETGRVEGCDRSAQRNGSNYIYNSDSAVPGTCTAAFELRMQECGYDRNLLV